MTKPLENRKAEALEEMDTINNDVINFAGWFTKYEKTITELLQPMPTDDEVDEAVKVINDIINNDSPDNTDKWAYDVLIRRAKQPTLERIILSEEAYDMFVKKLDEPAKDIITLKALLEAKQPSCDGLVEELEHLIRYDKDGNFNNFWSSLSKLKQALAEHRKGD